MPLTPSALQRIAVIGPNAAAPCYQGGTFAKIALNPNAVRPIEAIRSRFGKHCEVLYEMGVEPQSRLPQMPVAPAIDLGDGAVRGMSVEYFKSHDFTQQPIAAETRDTNSLTWFAGLPGVAACVDGAAGVRARGRFTAQIAGPHRFFVGATGSLKMQIDGHEVYAHEVSLAGSDIMGRLKAGDADSIEKHLDAGQSVDISIELRYEPARVQGLWYGIEGPACSDVLLARALRAAALAEVVILIVGETADSSVESKDRADTFLPKAQIELIERVCAVNPRTVVVTNVGHALDTSWQDRAAALLTTWYPGEEFAQALAEVLAGDREPGGRMPVTIAERDRDYPVFDLTPAPNGDLRYLESWRIGYRAFRAANIIPRHCLGSGFGYASFTLSDAYLDGPGWTVRVRVHNTASRPGKVVVQVYACDAAEGIPVLAGFTAAIIREHRSEQIEIAISALVLRRWNEASNDWSKEKRPIVFSVGQSLEDPNMHRFVPISIDLGSIGLSQEN